MAYMKKLSTIKKNEKIQYFDVANPDMKSPYIRTKKGEKK